jgi:L-alanine-DL-glutamate epimerase-like enolase superfamily enzyme
MPVYTYNTLDDPFASANTTVASGINDLGQIIGYYTDASGGHGFLLTVLPTPPSTILRPPTAPLYLASTARARSSGNSSAPGDIEREVEQRLKDGFHTFKIKVGKSAEDDVRRVKLIQRAIAGRATMGLDANRAYSEADACRFAMAS